MKKYNKLVKSVLLPITWVADYLITKQRRIKIEKGNIVKLKTPYLLLCTHASVLDYIVTSVMTFPRRVYSVCDELDFLEHNFIKRTRNCIYEHKYAKNPNLVKCIKKLLEENNIVALYPEIRYSFDGTNSALSPSLYKIIRMLKVPVVVLNIHGSFTLESCWNKKGKKGIIKADMIEIINEDEIKNISISEIEKRVNENMKYDEYEWQKENNYNSICKKKGNCNGLEHILYKCPSCMEEFKIVSKKDSIYCSSCGKQWKINMEDEFEAAIGKTEYKKVSDWMKFQRNKLRAEIMSCEYNMFSEIIVERLNKRSNKHELVDEDGELWHTEEGIMVFFKDDNVEYMIEKPSEDNYSYQVLYNYKNKGDCISLVDNDDVYYIYPTSDRFSVTKLAFAVEIMYTLVREYKGMNKKNIEKDDKIKKAIRVDVEDIINNEEEIEKENEDAVIAVEFRDDKVFSEEKMKEIKDSASTIDLNDNM